MGEVWSKEVDRILCVGRSLEEIGVRNWGLDREQALAALTKFSAVGIAVLGGDVYSLNGESVESTYDNWYCEREEHETERAFVERSILAARDFISNYDRQYPAVLFAFVPAPR